MNNDCKIVVIGGGTGLSVILRGLKKVSTHITAIVTTADDGGGSGKLREDLGMLPPGDIRNCILALADTETYMEELFQYRFKEGSLAGQNFGNLFIAALTGIYNNFQEGIAKVHEILAVRGRVIPVTEENISLCALLENGKIVRGESKISSAVLEDKTTIKKVFLDPAEPKAIPDALLSIHDADIIVLGPGSVYTSITPNLLVQGIVHAISESNAIKIYIANVMTQPGETDHYSVTGHVKALLDHADENIIEYVFVNNGKIPEDILPKYQEDGAEPVLLMTDDFARLNNYGIAIVEGPYIDVKKGYIRHDADQIAMDIMKLFNQVRELEIKKACISV
ncbi:MAG: gluconeogenesis factor YvcK family protein [Peptostreptococcales bacterium]